MFHIVFSAVALRSFSAKLAMLQLEWFAVWRWSDMRTECAVSHV